MSTVLSHFCFYLSAVVDAEFVVRKGAHILEGCELNVSFHTSFSGKPGHAETSQYSPAVSLGRPHSDYGAAHEDSYERTGNCHSKMNFD